ncbi:hypothetical protein [Clostridium tyrobutyricum]|uniref:hypothetical protein n=1 Tax=Clostridium tyrobutyricum TaxID=1519 RepID=UPI00057EBAF7|nr:hypothetical protein [Clostridium tyrobutyricum]
MMNDIITFYPKSLYSNIDFEEIKKQFTADNIKFKDFGSIIIAYTSNYTISINDIGKMEILYNNNLIVDKGKLEEQVKQIENIFKVQVQDFKVEVQM